MGPSSRPPSPTLHLLNHPTTHAGEFQAFHMLVQLLSRAVNKNWCSLKPLYGNEEQNLLLLEKQWLSYILVSNKPQQSQNQLSTRHAVGLYWVPGHAGVQGYEIADGLARGSYVLGILGSQLVLGVSSRDMQRRIRRWLINQHWVRWQGLGNTQRQARELISGPCLDARARFLSFNRTQSRAVTGLLTGHNTLWRHLHLLGLLDSPLCRGCGAEEETSAHILCECEALASLRHVYLGSFFLEPEDIKSISMGAIWNFSKVTELPQIDMGHKGPVNKAWVYRDLWNFGPKPKCNQSFNQSITKRTNRNQQQFI